MPHITLPDESSAFTFTQLTALFDCGCAYSNRSWKETDECLECCPEHKAAQVAIHTGTMFGVQPDVAETVKSTVKVNMTWLKSQLSAA